ncbi:hypothetical protein Rs2_31024 [Raphanus sativus]|nr:hypothetical protein Rs2_31024 [Raphanus sativus]
MASWCISFSPTPPSIFHPSCVGTFQQKISNHIFFKLVFFKSKTWRGAPQSARGAKVCWETVCTPKAEGGLGLKRLADWNQVSWIRRNRIGSDNFWELNPRQGDSWIWKQLCKLRALARPFVVCEIGTGSKASFWYDNWTELRPLIHLTGERGHAVSGMHKDATVADALRNGDWWLSASRSRNAIISLLKQCLPPAIPIVQSSSDDRYLWKMGNESPTDHFSTAKTWNVLHPPSPPVMHPLAEDVNDRSKQAPYHQADFPSSYIYALEREKLQGSHKHQ